MKSNQSRLPTLIDILITILIFLITFPRFEPVFGTGLDLSYTWAFNYLIHHDYNTLTSLVYPIGPLGFLKYVAAFENNLLIGLACFSVLKIILIWLLLKLDFTVKGKHSVVSVLLIIVAAWFMNFDFSIIGSTIVLLLLYNEKTSKYNLFIAANILALFGLVVKSSIGITSFSAIFSYLLFALVTRTISVKRAVMLQTTCVLIFIMGGSLVFNGLWSFINFLNRILHLAGGYSSGLALYPDNNWWLLSGFIISILAIPFILKSKSVRLAFLVSLLPFFAMWKHAMGREDIYHVQILIGFTLLVWTIIFANAKKYSLWFFILPICTLVLFYTNMRNVPQFNNYQINTAGFSNFNETFLHYNSFNSKYKKISEQAIQKHVISKEISKLIGRNTIDIYPWELSYVPANNLNWKPRKTLELGASTTNWLANKSAKHYEGDEAPEYILFQQINDKWGGSFGSLDGRYLLNDEPQLIFNLLENYKLERTTAEFLLFRKTINAKELVTKPIENSHVNWNEWVSVPKTDQGIIRAKFINRKNLAGKIKTFLYKDEATFVDYYLADGKIISYRFLPSNAADGLWIRPLIINPFGNRSQGEVEKIRFRCSNHQMVGSNIELKWENILVTEESTDKFFFETFDTIGLDELFSYHEKFEDRTKLDKLDSLSFSGDSAEVVGVNQFSTSYTISLDSIWEKGYESLFVESSVMYHAKNQKDIKAMLVMTLQVSDNDFWMMFPFADNMVENEWNYAFLKKGLDFQNHKSGILKIYVWNKGNNEVLIYDLTIVGYRNSY